MSQASSSIKLVRPWRPPEQPFANGQTAGAQDSVFPKPKKVFPRLTETERVGIRGVVSVSGNG
jgi:hypothetical protein